MHICGYAHAHCLHVREVGMFLAHAGVLLLHGGSRKINGQGDDFSRYVTLGWSGRVALLFEILKPFGLSGQ